MYKVIETKARTVYLLTGLLLTIMIQSLSLEDKLTHDYNTTYKH